ncbi:tannase/feruloyl esterase family alpha/beta hydrolase [Citricoccus sp. GCM10030269]|uniref:tannase/feruloyl esterase family alpha/beta hydrolase n=1 Tax=Citricoccus sp. GCM10030269 TaxID=3273388 RepID=UPI00361D19C6
MKSPRPDRRPPGLNVLVAAGTAGLLLSSMTGVATAATPDSSTVTSTSVSSTSVSSTTTTTPLQQCQDLAGFEFESTVITSAESVPAGTLSNRGEPIDEHCLVTGHMNERTSEVDSERYAIGFEMRLPQKWDGRYLYQANGGMDGSVSTALGEVGGGESGLQMGMAVISSDAGHNSDQNPTFGLDPQARLDYGYQAVGTLTPMATSLIEQAYGQPPHHSYITGGSNGGRHTMVAASRYTDEYDGFLALAPGFNLPQAAVAQLWEAQQWDTVATSEDPASALTQDEREVLAAAIREQCDDLDGLADGIVHNSAACQEEFSVEAHVPTCEGGRDGTCLSSEQKVVVSSVFAGATTSEGEDVYRSFPYDPGLVSGGWGFWNFTAPINLDSTAVGYVFSVPPFAPDLNALREFALQLDIDEANASIYESSDEYSESAMEFMTPPDLTYQDLKSSGGKMMVVHGASDGVFSMDDTTAWYRNLEEAHGGDASDFVQYFQVPGMDHVSGGPATDQHNALAALVDWVEQGDRPEELRAWVDPENPELPAEWSTERSRPLCAYPAVAEYTGGDAEAASSFECGAPDSEEPITFSDNEPGSAYFAPVQWMANNGISVGYADGTFKKNRDVSRGETTAFLHRYVQPEFSVPQDSPFSDVNPGGAYFTPITWASAEQITAGYADGTFKPSRAVSRGEFAAFLYRLESPQHTAPAESPFGDLSVGGANYDAITWLASQGITVGDTQGDFHQSDEITRAEISAFMQRYDRVAVD